MTLKLQKLTLTAHIVSTVGWIGAISAFLVLAITGVTSNEIRLVDSAYVAMKLIGWRVIVPLGLASLLTGLVQSLGTEWGLFRHYWVIVKFVLTFVATVLLLLHMTLVDRLAEIANGPAFFDSRFHGHRFHIMADAAGAVILLVVNTVLSVYKPRGMTRYGLRKQRAKYPAPAESAYVPELGKEPNTPRWVKVFGIAVVILLVLFRVVLLHMSGSARHHFH